MDNTLLINLSDLEFRLKAFTEYCEHRQKNYQEIMAQLSSDLSSIPDDGDEGVIPSLPEGSFNDESSILLNGGYIKLGDLRQRMFSAFSNYVVNGVPLENESSLVNLKDAAGKVVGSYSPTSILDQVREGLHSITCLVAANKAVASNSVSEAITVYRDEIQSQFSNAYSDISNTGAMMKNLLEKTTGNLSEYFSNLDAMMNLPALAADNSTEVPMNDSFSEFCGASPASALCSDLKKTGEVVSSVVNVGAKVVGGIVAGIFSLGKALFRKAVDYVHETLVDPKDLKLEKSGLAYSIDGFCYQGSFTERFSLFTGSTSDAVYSALLAYKGKWLAYDSKLGSLLVRITDIAKDASPSGVGAYYITYDCKARPKSADVHNFIVNTLIPNSKFTGGLDSTGQADSTKPFLAGHGVSWYYLDFSTQNPTNFNTVYSLLNELAGSTITYLDDSASEFDLLRSFLESWQLFKLMLFMNTSSNTNTSLVSDPVFCCVDREQNLLTYLDGSVKNRDFVTVASGYAYNKNGVSVGSDNNQWINSQTNSTMNDRICFYILDSGPQYLAADTSSLHNPSWGLKGASADWISGFLFHVYDELQHPIDYAFFPFTNDTWDLPSCKWIITSDETNRKAASTFVIAAITVVVVAAVAITASVLVKKISNVLTKRASERKSVLDQKMWNGERLTNKEWKQYKRASRKLSASSLINKGLQETTSGAADAAQNMMSSTSASISDIIPLIKG